MALPDTDHCTTCKKSLINVDAAILDSGWYCPDCVQPKYQWFIVEMVDGEPQDLIGGFPSKQDASSWAVSFCDCEWYVLSVTAPDFS